MKLNKNNKPLSHKYMKTAISTLKILIEFSIPLLFGFALYYSVDAIEKASANSFIELMILVFYAILFLEWIRRFNNSKITESSENKTTKIIDYLWLVILIILFYFSLQVIFASSQSHIDFLNNLIKSKNL